MLPRLLRVLPELLILTAGLLSQAVGTLWLLRRLKSKPYFQNQLRVVLLTVSSLGALLLIVGFFGRLPRFFSTFPAWWMNWGSAAVIIWSMLLLAWIAGHTSVAIIGSLWRQNMISDGGSSRRRFLGTLGSLAWMAPPVAVGYGVFIEREAIRVREQDIVVKDLPKDLDGLRLAQITDIHIGPFFDALHVARAVAMANELRPQITLITGDLLTRIGDPLDACIAKLAKLRAEAGVFGCMGNHEIYAESQDYTEAEAARHGMQFLRKRAVPLQFGRSVLNLGGVDYQNIRVPYLRGTESLVVPGAFNVLLSHNPDVFPVAASQGWDLTVSGHTHGGQVRVEILQADLNIARFYTPFTDGHYQLGSRSIFVSRGLGTIGVPARLGAPPEVALLRLRRASANAVEGRKIV